MHIEYIDDRLAIGLWGLGLQFTFGNIENECRVWIEHYGIQE